MPISSLSYLVSNFTSRLPQVSTPNVRDGLREIGGKTAAFFRFVSQGMADVLRSAGHALSSAQHALQATRARVATTSDSFTEVEKAALLKEARGSALYAAIGGPGSPSVLTKDLFENDAKALLSTPSAVAAMKAHGVTLSEAVAISIYSSQGFKAINDELRGEHQSPAVQALAEAFSNGLSKLPPYRNDSALGTTVYRGAILPENVGLSYQEGQVIEERGIMSTSFDEAQAFPRANYSVQIHLKPDSQGKDISAFSSRPEECEVAFPPGCKFQITGRELDGIDDFVEMYGGDRDSYNRNHPSSDILSSKMNIVMEEV